MTVIKTSDASTMAPGSSRRGPLARIVNRAAGRARAFRQDEDGAVVALTFFLFLIMIAAGGIAIDVMRHEMERARLQATLDAAVLAAAGSPFGTDARLVVEDYFETAGMSDYLDDVQDGDITSTLNASSVTARGSMEMDTYLMKLSGIDTLSTAGISTAEVRVPKLEVALVLDVSGSMGSNSKLTNLKSAAREFVTTILNSSTPGDTAISIVPFSWNVTPGEGIFEALTVNETHDYSTCINFSNADFSSASISPGTAYNQQIYTSLYGDFDSLSNTYRTCFTNDYAEIMPYSMNVAQLHAKINSLQASGNTSGHLGMKWGAALLDPAFQSVATSLRTAELIDARLTDIPAAYNEAETLKIIVMMGDGQNTSSYDFPANSSYRGANSDLYKVISQEMVFKYAYHKFKAGKTSNEESKCSKKKWECVYEASGPAIDTYYLRDGNSYYSIEDDEWLSSNAFALLATLSGFVSSERVTWEQAWGRMSPDYFDDITDDNGPWNNFYSHGRTSGGTKNGQMQSVCTATKAKNVVVYTIGFEISQGGTAESYLKNCASSLAHYFRAEGVNINDAFNSIASNVVNLRLTQ